MEFDLIAAEATGIMGVENRRVIVRQKAGANHLRRSGSAGISAYERLRPAGFECGQSGAKRRIGPEQIQVFKRRNLI